jgi:hypothetical protein
VQQAWATHVEDFMEDGDERPVVLLLCATHSL